MRSFFLVCYCLAAVSLNAQMPDSTAWRYGRGQLISNRAINIFLSEAAGYYLSGPDDLSLYKNSVIADAADGTLAIYHNLRQPSGPDDRVRSFLSIGARADIADAYTAAHNDRQYNNRFGALVKQTWIGKGSISATETQRKTMDALRTGILHALQEEITRKTGDFETSLNRWDSAQDVPGQDLAAAKDIAREKFRTDLQMEYIFSFAHRQAETLARTFNYKVMAFSWTSLSLYIPMVTENFTTAPSLSAPLTNRHAYPLQLDLTHTRLWEGSGFGRLYVTLAGDLLLNNTRDACKMDSAAFIGEYENFVTPAIKCRTVWFPRDSHIGISMLLQQHFGGFDALNAVIGVPIVLINKQAEPAVNLEFQVRFFDIGNRLDRHAAMPGRTSIGMTMGVPLSKIAF